MEFSDELVAMSAWDDQDFGPDIPAREDLPTFCDSYPLSKQRACFWYLPFTVGSTYVAHGQELPKAEVLKKVQSICETKQGQARRACIFGAGAYVYEVVTSNTRAARALCESYREPGEIAACVYGETALASNYTHVSTIISYCSALKDPAVRLICYKQIYQEVRTTPELGESVEQVEKLCPWTDALCTEAAAPQTMSIWDAITEAFPL